MIDRDDIAAYDQFWQSVPPCCLEKADICTGLWRKARVIKPSRAEGPDCEGFDVIVAGGGAWGMLMGSMLAKRGFHVLILEKNSRFHCGATWNISRPEFADLKKTGILPESVWEGLVTGEFTEGVFRLFDDSAAPPGQREFHFDEILNVSLDETKYFSLLSATPGLSCRLDARAALERLSRTAAYVRYGDPSKPGLAKGRLLIDATGWTSPLAALANYRRETDAVYNMLGFRTDRKLPRALSPSTGRPMGLICTTFENEIASPAGPVQPILERFTDYVPGLVDRGDVIYYFTRTPRAAPILPLVGEMLARIHYILPGFSEEMVERTYFGHAPAYRKFGPFSRYRLQMSAGDRILLVGTAAFQYNDLTGCGFGPLVRNAMDLCNSIARLLSKDRLTFSSLKRVDIDPRERVSMEIGDLFVGATQLTAGETPGTVNHDWISFTEAAEGMDQHLKNEAFRDKVRLETLNQLIRVCAVKPKVIGGLIRNNRGRIGAVVWTFISAYARLLFHELRLFAGRRKRKYFTGGSGAVMRLPGFAVNVAKVWSAGRAVSRLAGKAKRGDKG